MILNIDIMAKPRMTRRDKFPPPRPCVKKYWKFKDELIACAEKEGFVLGDKVCDIELGNRLGAATFLVRTGYGAQVEAKCKAEPSFIVDDVLAAVPFIERQLKAVASLKKKKYPLGPAR